MIEGHAKTVQTWKEFLSRSLEEQKEILRNMHGGHIMYQQIQEAMSRQPIPPNNTNHRWVGVFSRLEVLLVVKGYSDDNVEYKCIMDVFKLSPWTSQVRAICVNSIKRSCLK